MMDWTFTPLLALKILVVLAGVMFLIAMHRSDKYPEFDFVDLVMDGGKISPRLFFESGAWFLTSVWLLTKILTDKADLADITTYSGIWVLARTGGQYINAQRRVDVQSPTA